MAFDIGSLTANFGGFLSVLGSIFTVLFVVLLFGAIMFYIFREMQFKLPVVIHKVLGDGSVIEIKDVARKFTKNGQNELKLKKLKEVVSNPPPDYYLKTSKGEKIYFRWDGGHVFVPQKVTYNSPLEFKPATYNILNQMAWRIKTASERHKNKTFWDLYGNIIVWVTVIVLSAVVLIVLFSKLEQVGSALQANANAINSYAEAVKALAGQQVIQ